MMMAHGGPVLGADSADWDSMAEMMRGMMPSYGTGLGKSFWGLHWILGVVTWILVIILLVAATRWFWKKGDKL